MTRTALACLLLPVAAPATAQVPTYLPAPAQSTPPAIGDSALRAATKPIVARKIILVGDSTVAVGSGWGGAFCAEHLTSFVACLNLARGGRSSFSYRAEGSWALALGEMKAPGYAQVYVLIQFGHNDQPGKPGRSTDLASEFPANLRRYVTEARATGAIPVLVTPLTRRIFKDGSLQDGLEPWARATRAVAAAMQVPLIDLHARSLATVQAMGASAATTLAEAPPPADVLAAATRGTTIDAPKDVAVAPTSGTEVTDAPGATRRRLFDYTHLGDKGARLFSAQVASLLVRGVPALRGDVIP